MRLLDVLVPTYIQMLKALSQWLDKAEAQTPEGGANALLAARLAPDMFPLATQVRFSCAQAQEGIFRLLGRPFPATIDVLLNEGRQAGEHPGSLDDARLRIEETIAVLEECACSSHEVAEVGHIAHALPNGMIFDFTAEEYVRDWTLPQFYFHVMTAYAIMRANGVALGKADYVAHMLTHLRPGTMPQA